MLANCVIIKYVFNIAKASSSKKLGNVNLEMNGLATLSFCFNTALVPVFVESRPF